MAVFPHLNAQDRFPGVSNVNTFRYVYGFDYTRWEPGTTLKLCNATWDSAYENVCKFADDKARDAYFDGLEGTTVTLTAAARLLPDREVKIPVPFDVAMTFNYLMVDFTTATSAATPIDYEDENGFKRFYFFIQKVEYRAPSATAIYLQLDEWTTYINHVDINYMMLERGHAPFAAVSVADYLQAPYKYRKQLCAPDVNYGDETPNRKQLAVGGSDRVVFIAVSLAYADIIDMRFVKIAAQIDPAFSDIADARNGYQAQVADFAYAAGGSDYSDISTTVQVPDTAYAYTPTPITAFTVGDIASTTAFLQAVREQAPQFYASITNMCVIPSAYWAQPEASDFTITLNDSSYAAYLLKEQRILNDVDLTPADFGFADEYSGIAKLYTYPYSELVFKIGKTEKRIRVEDTGYGESPIALFGSTVWQNGTIKLIAAILHAGSFAGSDLSDITSIGAFDFDRYGIETDATCVEVRVSAYELYKLRNYNANNTIPQLENELEYVNAVQSADTACENAIASAENAYANANASLSLGNANALRSAEAAYQNALSSAATALENATASNNAAYDNVAGTDDETSPITGSAPTARDNAYANADNAKTNADLTNSVMLTNAGYQQEAIMAIAGYNQTRNSNIASRTNTALDNLLTYQQATTTANASTRVTNITDNAAEQSTNITDNAALQASNITTIASLQSTNITDNAALQSSNITDNAALQTNAITANTATYNAAASYVTSYNNGLLQANQAWDAGDMRTQNSFTIAEGAVPTVASIASNGIAGAISGGLAGGVGAAAGAVGGVASGVAAAASYSITCGLQTTALEAHISNMQAKVLEAQSNATNILTANSDAATNSASANVTAATSVASNNAALTTGTASNNSTLTTRSAEYNSALTTNTAANTATATKNIATHNSTAISTIAANDNVLAYRNTDYRKTVNTISSSENNEAISDTATQQYNTLGNQSSYKFRQQAVINTNNRTTARANADRSYNMSISTAANSQAVGNANADRTSTTAQANAKRTYDAAVANANASLETDSANATRNADTAKANAVYTRDQTVQNEQRRMNVRAALARARYLDERNGASETLCEASCDDVFADRYYSGNAPVITVETQNENAIAQAGDYFLRYGYAYNQAWRFTDFNLMAHFTYWKCSDLWLTGGDGVLESGQETIKGALKRGVTVWSDPDEIGAISIYDNHE